MADIQGANTDRQVTGRDVHVQAAEARISHHSGDVLLIPRTWLADAMRAKPHQLALTMFWIGFGLTAGAGIGVVLITMLQGIIKAATHG